MSYIGLVWLPYHRSVGQYTGPTRYVDLTLPCNLTEGNHLKRNDPLNIK